MGLNDDSSDRRSLLFDYHEEGKSGKGDWSSPSPDSEESEMESSFHLNSYDVNSNLFRNGSEFQNVPEKFLYPPPSSSTLPKYPKEKMKTLLALGLVLISLVLNAVSIALTHDRIPDGPPLPDVVHFIPAIPELMTVPDILVLITIFFCFTTIILHHHRWIVARRVFFMLSLLYTMRSVTMYSTVLPVANYTVYCSPKSNTTSATVIVSRVSQLLGGGGMQISGQKKTCGDYIYSGHTVILMCGYLILKEYSPRKFVILHWISCVMSWCGMGILLLARGHYTIDVLIGYYAATRTFWTYHSLCNNAKFKKRTEDNYYSNVWWFPVFQYLEGNVGGRLPQQYSYPWSLQKHKIRNSIFR